MSAAGLFVTIFGGSMVVGLIYGVVGFLTLDPRA